MLFFLYSKAALFWQSDEETVLGPLQFDIFPVTRAVEVPRRNIPLKYVLLHLLLHSLTTVNRFDLLRLIIIIDYYISFSD